MSVEGRTNKAPALFFLSCRCKNSGFYQYLPCQMFLLFLFCTTKIGEISDIAKCFENFVSQTLGFLTSFYAAELRYKKVTEI